jgi:hypothetical protein
VKQIPCRGITDTGEPAFNKEDAQQVIVKVYENGVSFPLCHCFAEREFGMIGSCNYKFLNEDIEESARKISDQFKNCIYHRGK